MTLESEISDALHAAWPERTPTVAGKVTDLSQGRGVFSRVHAIALDWSAEDATAGSAQAPETVAIKLPPVGANRQVAVSIGAFAREAQAYSSLLQTPTNPAAPGCYGILQHHDGACSFVLEDLSPGRFTDQVEGLSSRDSQIAARALGHWHDPRQNLPRLKLASQAGLRGPTTSALGEEGMNLGLQSLDTTWSEVVSNDEARAFQKLVLKRHAAISAFESLTPSLCHGDARADNFVFDYRGTPIVLLDWQQTAIQTPEADLAWLCATSLEPDLRRSIEAELVESFALAANRPVDTSWDNYRRSLVLPGLAVLFLAQRQIDSPQTRRFVASSLRRIAAAIMDHEIV